MDDWRAAVGWFGAFLGGLWGLSLGLHLGDITMSTQNWLYTPITGTFCIFGLAAGFFGVGAAAYALVGGPWQK